MIQFSRSGQHMVTDVGDELLVLETEHTEEARAVIAVAGLLGFGVFDEEIWYVSAGPGGPELRRTSLSGVPQGGVLSLPRGGAQRLVSSSVGGAGAVWLGERTIELRARGTAQSPTVESEDAGEGIDFALPLGDRGRLEVRQGSLHRVEQGERSPLGPVGRVLDGAALHDGRAALLVESGGRADLIVVDTKSGAAQHRVPLEDAVGVAFAARRAQAIVRQGARRLRVLDLRFGREVRAWDEPFDVVELAADGGGSWMALVHARGDEATLVCRPFAQPPAPGRRMPRGEPSHGPARPAVSDGEGDVRGDVDGEARSERRGPRSTARIESLDALQSLDALELPDGNGALPMPDVFHADEPLEPFARSMDDDERADPDDPTDDEEGPPIVIPHPIALAPHPPHAPIAHEALRPILDGQRALLDAWCALAIAAGWDSGRIGFPEATGLPFEQEVGALLGGRGSVAGPAVQSAIARVSAQPSVDAVMPGAAATPLGRLAEEFQLCALAQKVLLVVGGPLLWGHLARLYAIIANDKGRRLCDEYLVSQVLAGEAAAEDIARELDPASPLIASGLVILSPGVRPFAELRLDPIVSRRLRGEPFDAPEPGDVATLRPANRLMEELALPRTALVELARAVGQRPEQTGGQKARIVLDGREGSGRRSVLAALAALAHRPLGVLDVAHLSGEGAALPERLRIELRRIVLRGWLPCLTGLDRLAQTDGAPLVRDQLRTVLRDHQGPLLFRAPPDAHLPLDPGHVVVHLPPLPERRRIRCWQDALARHRLSTAGAETLAAMYRVGPGVIERVVEHVARSRKGGGGDLLVELRAALQQHHDDAIGSVATRVKHLPTWSSVVLPPEVLDSIREFIARVRHRRQVYEAWGFSRIITASRGLTALFMGGPGTGKTLVAGIIARELGFDLYRVDLSRVMSKWIGETEQRLSAVFDAAEDGQVVIVFDEADSLFARRTEVRTSVDRYANAEVNYLLQRLDAFEGIAILTTNLGASIDAAFKRRLSIRLTFPFPDEEMREQLWRVHIPEELPVAGRLDFRTLAQRHQLSGGYIRNAALRAAFLAAQEEVPLTQEHLDRAVALEYQEMGKIVEGGVLE